MSTRIQGQPSSIKQEGKKVVRKATTSPLMENLLRLGYIVRGLVYGVIGVLALQVATGTGGALTDTKGAIAYLGRSPLGNLLLYAVLAGLIAYGLWGLIRADVDPLHKGTTAKGIAARVGYAVSGISYLFLAYLTFGLITGRTPAAAGSQTAQAQQMTASILSKPWGLWVVVIVSLAIIGAGVTQIYQGLSASFDKQYAPYALSYEERKWLIRLGRFGTAARGLVFLLIGVFLFQAGYQQNPSQAKGIDGALAALLHQPYGSLLLGVVALGLIAFGLYSAFSGVWLRLRR